MRKSKRNPSQAKVSLPIVGSFVAILAILTVTGFLLLPGPIGDGYGVNTNSQETEEVIEEATERPTATLTPSPSPTEAEPVTIRWFVGLGIGTNEAQLAVEEQIVADFNASQDEIILELLVAADYNAAIDMLNTMIEADIVPDIVGPIDITAANIFNEQWLDLEPYISSTGYDLNQYEPSLVEIYRNSEGELLSLPFDIFPSLVYYNRGLFDAAGLNYPPTEFDAPYIMPDGSEVEWNYQTLAEIAQMLTLDDKGNNATSADFDAENIVQFGFNFQWQFMPQIWIDMQPEKLYDATTNSVTIPDTWRSSSEWLYDALWENHFMPDTRYYESDLFGGGNTFASGHVAMAIVPLWYTCCIAIAGNFDWDFAVVPRSFDGNYHVSSDDSSFYIMEGSKHPEAAFIALSYLLNEAVPSLIPVYGAYPALPQHRELFIELQAEQYPSLSNWQLVSDSLAYINEREFSYSAYLPNSHKANDRLMAFYTLIFGDTGADIDIQAEVDALEADLNAIINN